MNRQKSPLPRKTVAAIAMGMLVIVVVIAVVARNRSPRSDDYAAARAAFKSKLAVRGPSPQPYERDNPPAGVRAVKYRSGELELKAWLSEPPGAGKKPAVLFLHGGFAFGLDDWTDQAAHYAEAGYVVMAPMLRGENGNPGLFEMWYGEVGDAMGAAAYLAKLPSVDAERIFVAGHSAGGTLAMLVAEADPTFAGAAAFSGSADRFAWIEYPGSSELCPFDKRDKGELRIRSPVVFAASLKCPLFLYYGSEEDWCRNESGSMVKAGERAGKKVSVREIPGDHMSSVPGAIRESLREFGRLRRGR